MLGRKQPRWKPPKLRELEHGTLVWVDEADGIYQIRVCSCGGRTLCPWEKRSAVWLCRHCKKAL